MKSPGLEKKLFVIVNTHGYPLSMALEQLSEARIKVKWAEFYKYTRKAGWSDITTQRIIENAIMECESFKRARNVHGGSQCQI